MPTVAHVGLLLLTLDLPACNSLKDKRRVLSSLLSRIRREMHISAAEVGLHDRHRSSVVAFALLSGARAQVERLRDRIERFVEGEPRLVVVEREWTWL
ncbi:MAG: DUF503 domain-containing protein [Armatimonadota bacterium]